MTSEGDEYPGEHSRKVGLTVACLIDEVEDLPQLTCLTKGIVYELSLLRKAYNIPWCQFYDWAKALCGGSVATTFSSFKVMVGRLEKKRAELSRNKKHDELEHLLLQPFSVQQEYTSSEETGMSEVEKALEKEKSITDELTFKLSKLSICNVNKRIKRRDLKLAESQSQVKQLESKTKSQAKTINKLESKLKTAHSSAHSLRQKLHRSNERVEAKSDTNKELDARLDSLKSQFSSKFDELQQIIEALQQKIEALSIEIEVARQERDEHADRLEEIESGTICTKNGQKYLDGVRQCCIELLSMNVATKQM